MRVIDGLANHLVSIKLREVIYLLNQEALKEHFEKNNLYFKESDLEYVEKMLHYIDESKKPLEDFPHLKDADSYLIVDKGELI